MLPVCVSDTDTEPLTVGVGEGIVHPPAGMAMAKGPVTL